MAGPTTKTILVIDDSATIRRLVDSHLGARGYSVVLAPTAEEGLTLAHEVRPDLILLDHQLPGTTGCEVCAALVKDPQLRLIPVVVSSTLRKRAYVEYADLANVVDMLPKPYTTELLETTVANSLETGNMIVHSQADGTAVPEVIETQTEASLSGTCANFGLREVIDFLNHGEKSGVLEIAFSRSRIWMYLRDGRIQAVTATGLQPQELMDQLPESLRDLAPVFEITIGAHRSTGADGLVQLLNNKVLDPRLLKKLLRHQASVLTTLCFHDKAGEFRFHAQREAPLLCQQLPLDTSLVALLVEGALVCSSDHLPTDADDIAYERSVQRGQNLDRSGLAPAHMKVLSSLGDPTSPREMADRLGTDADTVQRILHGLSLAGLAQVVKRGTHNSVVAFNTDSASTARLRELFAKHRDSLTGKLVRDPLAFKLLLKRHTPTAILFRVENDSHVALLRDLSPLAHGRDTTPSETTRWIALADADYETELAPLVHVVVSPVADDQDLLRELQPHRLGDASSRLAALTV